MAHLEDLETQPNPIIIYDGACPVCRHYVTHIASHAWPEAECIDARLNDQLVRTAFDRGLDVNAGMIFIEKGRIHHASSAFTCLTSRPANRQGAYRVLDTLLRASAARPTYWLLRVMRRSLLLLLRVPRLGS